MIGISPRHWPLQKAVAIRRELASAPDSDSSAKLDLARSLNATGSCCRQSDRRQCRRPSTLRRARSLAGPLADVPARPTWPATSWLCSHHQIGLGSLGGPAIRPSRWIRSAGPWRSAEAGRRLPRRHRLPQPPGDQPRQYRRSAASDRPAGQRAGVAPSRLAIRQKLADENPAVTNFRPAISRSATTISAFCSFGTGQPAEGR